jgi:hypothetical protein
LNSKMSISGNLIDRAMLAANFHQPYGRLTSNDLRQVTAKPVAQVRIAVEVLRSFLANNAAFPEYCFAAYSLLLTNMGTSYSEVRFARIADSETRRALANRLGLAVADLELLFLVPNEMTEANLQTRFGLPDTTQDPLTVVPRAALLTRRLSKLHENWLAEDQIAQTNTSVPVPAIDPDVLTEADLKSPVSGNSAYDLFITRKQWVADQLQAIRQVRESAPTLLEGFDQAVRLVLGNIDLVALAQDHRDGQDIEPVLTTVPLELAPFLVLVQVREMAAAELVLESEWEDFYNILTQVKKRQMFAAWANAEIASNLTLEPAFFTLSPARPEVIPWRSSWRTRRDWEKKLTAREKQQDALIQAQQSAIDATEEIALPLLRDHLIDTIDRQGYPAIDIKDWLTQRLSISFKYSGDQKLTRMEQGIETLQDILQALRTGRVETLPSLPVGTAFPQWELARTADYTESHFDKEWEWMGNYATWRGAMFAFGYPENYLLPTLRDKSAWTEAFAELVTAVRKTFRLTPDGAESLAKDYLANVKDENGTPYTNPHGIILTSRLSKQELRDRRTFSRHELQNYVDPQRGGLGADTPAHLQEIYFFVPLLLAMALQKKGEFLAALDWFQTIYAYELPVNERKVYFGLEAEEALPTEFRRTFGWLLDGLDVFDIANDRANALTRFTLISIVRCYLAFADAEFTRETNESIPLARRLYITAQELLNLLRVPPPTAHWGFDEQEEGTASDLSGNGHHAILPNSTDIWQDEGWQGGAISLNATAAGSPKQYVEVPHAPALALGHNGADFSLTLGLYLRADATGQWRTVVRKGDRQNPAERTPGIWLRPDSNRLHFRISTTVAANEGGDSQSTLPLHAWTHLAYVKQGQSLKLYIDGQLDSEATLKGESIGFAAPLLIGGDDSTLDGTNAMFDEVRIYDRALSADVVIALAGIDAFPPNPIIDALKRHAELNLQKLRTGRNIAGMERVRSAPPALQLVPTDGQLVPPAPAVLRPTAYRYSALIERAKQLATLAQQMEANFLSALEKRDAETYKLLSAQHDVELTKETVELQDLRLQEANGSIVLTGLQQDRAQIQFDTFNAWVIAGPNSYERKMLKNYQDLKAIRNELAVVDVAATVANATVNAAGAGLGAGPAFAAVGVLGEIAGVRAALSREMNDREAELQANSFNANLERRKDEWRLQRALAEQDIEIAEQQLFQAALNKEIVGQERVIASTRADQAEAVVAFLNNKFTNVELYEWMSDILSEVYGFFLQQATAMAQLALNQLAFERQERPPAFIRSDYWQAPEGAAEENAPDRLGLTGSARLLQDIFQLDQYAFETNKRKLQLVERFSLARLVPFEFQQFRETGVLPFATPMALFDQGFPGHYLRLIKRVHLSILGLIPPTTGVRAMLSTAGVSRVVTGSDVFRMTDVRRPPEMIAFTSPSDATGLFELQPENDLLLPFETMGVDAQWELQLPKAANRFNFDSIADVIFSVEYTALFSADYRQQVIQTLDRTFSAERAYSLKHDFPDLWYHLHHPDNPPDGSNEDILAAFTIEPRHFPPNLQQLRIAHLVLYFSGVAGNNAEITMSDLRFTPRQTGSETSYGGATSVDGVISTRRANATGWLPLLGQSPAGEWTFVFPPEFSNDLHADRISDIVFVVSYAGDTPLWPD